MPVAHAVILGIIQGLTEVLPISSSAHLFLFPWFFKWHYQGLSFDVALHAGTALAFMVYFFKDWIDIITGKKKLFWYIVIATIPAALAGLLLEDKAEIVFRSPLLVAIMLALFGIILWLADNLGRKERPIEKLDFRTVFTIGLAQTVALIPGVSRSGVTITAGLFKGLTRQAAARFSFLLATPIVVAAGALKLSKLHISDLNPPFWTGILFSALSGLIGIHFLLGFVRKSSLNAFVYYRIILAVIILALYFARY
ncbi:MAG: undecaprenyl-diphosphate phosphatase [Candidatus Omnitrophota bacterium]|jgi:undecaprenyl-diphosphatase